MIEYFIWVPLIIIFATVIINFKALSNIEAQLEELKDILEEKEIE